MSEHRDDPSNTIQFGSDIIIRRLAAGDAPALLQLYNCRQAPSRRTFRCPRWGIHRPGSLRAGGDRDVQRGVSG